MRVNKIILIGPTESVLTKRGNRFPNMAQYFVENSLPVYYYTSNFYHAEKRFFKKAEITEAKKSIIYKLKVFKVLGYYSNVSARRVLSNFLFSLFTFFHLLFTARKGDKIILPSRPVELIFFMALLKRLKRNSIFLDIQDVWPDALDIENKRKKRIFEIYCNIYLRPSLRAYTNTFHVAPSFQTWLHRYAPECPSVFIPLGWENDRWPENPTPHIIDVNKRIRLVCVAQLQYQIDIRPVLEVLAGNERLHLTIIGEDGSGKRYSQAKDYIDQKNIKNIQIIGKVSRTEVVRLLKEQDLGILPMITTSIPNKIFDYMASFLPSIVLGENDSADFVVSNGIGWSCKYNSNDLNKLIDSLSNEDIIEKKERVIQVREMYSRNQTHKTILETIS